jgi:hypothetical protein
MVAEEAAEARGGSAVGKSLAKRCEFECVYSDDATLANYLTTLSSGFLVCIMGFPLEIK